MQKALKAAFAVTAFAVLLMPIPSHAHSGRPQVLDGLKKDTETELARLDKLVFDAALKLKGKPVAGAEARAVLKSLCAGAAYMVECSTIDSSGKLSAIEPEAKRGNEGADISSQKHVAELIRTGKPVMSGYFREVGGDNVVSIAHPILDVDGKVAGSVSIIFKPAALLEPVFSVFKGWCPVDFDVMQSDGMILYGIKKGETGKNLFKDPRLAGSISLKKLAKTIASQGAGSGVYSIGEDTASGKKAVEKEAHWDTVLLDGMEWKLVIIHDVGRKMDSKNTVQDIEAVQALSKDLADLSMSPELAGAVDGTGAEPLQKIIKRFYDSHKLIYAIEWLDPDGTVKAGYPAENSIINYNFNSKLLDGDEQFLDALESKKGGLFKQTLAEGDVGQFVLKPVIKGDKFLGIVYIVIKARSR